MPVTAENAAPYAPPSAVLEVINRRRDRGLTAPITADVLARAGVSSSLISRTLQTLQTLDLIDDAGAPTPTFEALRVAPTAEFKDRMQEWLKSAYADVFSFVDPAKDDEQKITDAFRAYTPHGMQRRMVILFRELCAAAGLAPEKSASESQNAARKAQRVFTPVTKKVVQPSVSVGRFATKKSGALPPAVAGLIESLPSPDEGWTAADRQKFLKTFESVLDFAIPVVKEKKETAA